MGDLYIGLMSGTSMDGIDAALIEFGESSLKILQTLDHPYPAALREQLLDAISIPLNQVIENIPELDQQTGACFCDAALALLDAAGVDAAAVTAIGSHGQTLRHQPDAERPFTLQIGDPALIAAGTGITTVADFRSADIAAGGQGAPLAPFFHEWLFRSPGTHRAVLNIGGIANITVLSDEHATIGFDTGPGNTLMDAWIRKQRDEAFDQSGSWAGSGTVSPDLLQRFLSEPYFSAPPPKSTGFELFNVRWIEAAGTAAVAAADVQATLCALTAQTVADAVTSFAADTNELLVCGGGVHNNDLLQRIKERLPGVDVLSTAAAGLEPDWVEAVAFAWLAMRRLHDLPGNLPSVTGAKQVVMLGSVHLAD